MMIEKIPLTLLLGIMLVSGLMYVAEAQAWMQLLWLIGIVFVIFATLYVLSMVWFLVFGKKHIRRAERKGEGAIKFIMIESLITAVSFMTAGVRPEIGEYLKDRTGNKKVRLR